MSGSVEHRYTDMSATRQEIINMVEKMPAFPQSVHRVLQLTSDINVNPKDLVEVIEHDPVLILKILKLVNSPYFGLAQKITSVNHAIIYIGINTMKNLALSTAAIGMLPKRNEAGFDMQAFLLHSLSTATIAKLIAKKMNIPEKEAFDYFLSGLLHDFGKVVFAHYLPQEFQRALQLAKEKKISLHEAEQGIFGVDHAGIGSLLGEKWQLPPNLVESLGRHHLAGDSNLLMTSAVSAADQISKDLKIGYSGDNTIENLPETITKVLGPDVNGIVKVLGDVDAEVEKSLTFMNL